MVSFCKKMGLDGFELFPFCGNTLETLPRELVRGVHLAFHNCWVDFWNGNEAGVLREFGNMETAKKIIAPSKEAMIERYIAQLDFAESVGAEYVVFHISDVSIPEAFSAVFQHSDKEVIDASLDLINKILSAADYSFQFLVENLWHTGLTMVNPEMTEYLLQGMKHQNKGIMLDTGHLMHTNSNLNTSQEALAYINQCLDRHGKLCSHIKGIHLHQSLSGEHIKRMISNPPRLPGGYEDRLSVMYAHYFVIDSHRPFIDGGVKELVERVDPEFLNYEFITRSREEHEGYIRLQNDALGFGGR